MLCNLLAYPWLLLYLLPCAPHAPQSASFSLLQDDSLDFLEGIPHKARMTMRKHVIDAVMVCVCAQHLRGKGCALSM